MIRKAPLLGGTSFGIIDNGTDILEVKPVTGCRFDCVHCSTYESIRKKQFIVKEEWLFEWIKYAASQKELRAVYLTADGEVILYPYIEKLVRDIKSIGLRVILDNHGFLLEEKIKTLIGLGLDRINININTLRQDRVKKIYGVNFNIEKLLNLLTTLKTDIVISPVISIYNIDEMEDIAEWSINHGFSFIPMNYIQYPYGKKMEQISFLYFKKKINLLEKKYGVSMTLRPRSVGWIDHPFNIGDIITIKRFIKDRYDRFIGVYGDGFDGRIVLMKKRYRRVRIKNIRPFISAEKV